MRTRDRRYNSISMLAECIVLSGTATGNCDQGGGEGQREQGPGELHEN